MSPLRLILIVLILGHSIWAFLTLTPVEMLTLGSLVALLIGEPREPRETKTVLIGEPRKEKTPGKIDL